MSKPGASESKASEAASAAFFRSTTWRLVFAFEVLTVIGGSAGYYFTKSLLAFAPFCVAAALVSYTLFQFAKRSRAANASANDPPGPIVR